MGIFEGILLEQNLRVPYWENIGEVSLEGNGRVNGKV